MANREKILSTITGALKNDFVNVTNKFKVTDDLLLESTPTAKAPLFPWVNVGLGAHTVDLSIDGQLEVQTSIPIIITAYDKIDVNELDTLQVIVARLIDALIDSLTSSTNTATFCTAGVGILNFDIVPVEDEIHSNIGIAILRVNAISGD